MIDFLMNAFQFKKTKITLALVSSISVVFQFLILFAIRDERVTRTEWLLSSGLFLISFTFFFWLCLKTIYTPTVTGTCLLLSTVLAFGVLVFKMLPFPDRIFLITEVRAEILDLEPNTEVELFWAYWSDGEKKVDSDEDTPRQIRDMSYSDFDKNSDWRLNNQGILATSEKGAVLDLSRAGLHNGSPVLCFIASGGDALIYLRFNGEKMFYSLNSSYSEPTPIYRDIDVQVQTRVTHISEFLSLIILLFPIVSFFICQLLRNTDDKKQTAQS